MKRKRWSEEQAVAILNEREAGTSADGLDGLAATFHQVVLRIRVEKAGIIMRGPYPQASRMRKSVRPAPLCWEGMARQAPAGETSRLEATASFGAAAKTASIAGQALLDARAGRAHAGACRRAGRRPTAPPLTGGRIAAATGISLATVARILKRAGLSQLKGLEPEGPARCRHDRPGSRTRTGTKRPSRFGRPRHRIACAQAGRRQGAGRERARIRGGNGPRCASHAFAATRKGGGGRHLWTKPYMPRTNGDAEPHPGGHAGAGPRQAIRDVGATRHRLSSADAHARLTPATRRTEVEATHQPVAAGPGQPDEAPQLEAGAPSA